MVKNSTLLGLGIGGSIVAALCCFTPVLFVLLGVVGLGALTGYLDYVLLPALVLFVAITLYALKRRRETRTCCTVSNEEKSS
ncbi:MAG: mercury resistance system transport protein MerF [Betaproteobacteria bacterium]